MLVQNPVTSHDPSELVIPAVKGEFYSYSSVFTDTHPLFVFMKCKAQKSRTLSSASKLGEDVNAAPFIETWLARADISTEAFYGIRSTKDEAALVNASRRACSSKEGSIELQPGVVYAAMTNTGKYCLFLVNELLPTSAEVDACHILI